jgi:broad specificity phosphatase PhoE
MRSQGFPADEPLEARSLVLARKLATQLAEADAAYAADSERSRETATLLGIEPVVRDDLNDQDYGAWRGRSLEELQSENPEALHAWMTDPDFAPPSGESIAAVAKRAAAFLHEMRQSAGHVVAVTHPAIVRTAVLGLLGAPLTAYWRIDAPPLSVTDLRYDGRRWAIRAHGVVHPA